MSNGLEPGHGRPDVERLELLRLHASTRGLDDEQLNRLAAVAEVVRVQEGQAVHRASDPIGALILVVFGRLKMSASLPGGAEKTILYLGRDDQFGLLGLSGQELLPVNVVAEQNSTLVRIPVDVAPQLLDELPLWRRNLAGSLGLRLRETLLDDRRRKHPRIVGLIHMRAESRRVTPLLVQRLSELQERVGLLSDDAAALDSAPGPVSSLVNARGAAMDLQDVRKVVGHWPELDRVILDMGIDHAGSQLTALTNACDAILWVTSSDASGPIIDGLTPVLQTSPGWKEKTYLVWLLGAQEQVAPFVPELTSLFAQDFKLHWQGGFESPACSQRAGLERIVHHLRGISIGLALGGGAARGMAHLGVLQVLEEAGVTLDRVAGTSAGALTGINYAAGYAPSFQVTSFAKDLTPAWYYRMLPYGDSWYLLGKYRRSGWDRMLRKYLHDWRLEQLPIPISSVAVDLVQADQVVRRQGDAVDALLESINLPFISRPICRDGAALVDGGILNVVPADVLVSQDANIVIAVDVSTSLLSEFAGNRPDTPTAEMKTPNTAQMISRVRLVQDRNLQSIGGGAADVVIQPDVATVDVADFKHTAEIADLGRTAAESSLANLRDILHQMDPQLFPR